MKALDIPVLPRTTWFDVQRLHFQNRQPLPYLLSDEFRAIVAADVLGYSALQEQLIECIHHFPRTQLPRHLHPSQHAQSLDEHSYLIARRCLVPLASHLASMWAEDDGFDFRHLIIDRDSKFTELFCEIFKQLSDAKEAVAQTGIRAPKMNLFCESFIGHAKSECMNHFVCFNLNQPDRIVSSCQRCHNQHRPHHGKGIGNCILDPSWQLPPPICTVKRQKILGGLLNHYYRDSGYTPATLTALLALPDFHSSSPDYKFLAVPTKR